MKFVFDSLHMSAIYLAVSIDFHWRSSWKNKTLKIITSVESRAMSAYSSRVTDA